MDAQPPALCTHFLLPSDRLAAGSAACRHPPASPCAAMPPKRDAGAARTVADVQTKLDAQAGC